MRFPLRRLHWRYLIHRLRQLSPLFRWKTLPLPRWTVRLPFRPLLLTPSTSRTRPPPSPQAPCLRHSLNMTQEPCLSPPWRPLPLDCMSTIIVPMSYTLPAPPCPQTRRAFQIHNRQTNSTAPPAARVRIVTAWNPSAVLCLSMFAPSMPCRYVCIAFKGP